MANPNERKPVMFVGALAAIAVAIEGAILLARKTGQAVLSLPKEIVDLISAIAQGVGSIIEKLDAILDAIRNMVTGGGAGFPPNADGITAVFVSCPFAQPQSFQLPNIQVPQDCNLLILARNPAGVNAGIIYVAPNQVAAGANMQSYPLIANATVAYRVKNANSIWIGATVANDGVYLTVEQMGSS